MHFKPLNDEARVAEVADAVVAALRPHLANEYKSTANEAAATTKAYSSGLTNGETRLGIIRALSVLQLEQMGVFTSLITEDRAVEYAILDGDGSEASQSGGVQ